MTILGKHVCRRSPSVFNPVPRSPRGSIFSNMTDLRETEARTRFLQPDHLRPIFKAMGLQLSQVGVVQPCWPYRNSRTHLVPSFFSTMIQAELEAVIHLMDVNGDDHVDAEDFAKALASADWHIQW